MRNKETKETATWLRSIGLTYQEIGEMLNVTNSYLLINPRPYREKSILEKLVDSEKAKAYSRKYILTINGERIKVNKRTRPNDICELCNKEFSRLDYHHWDDNNPKYGLWLCHRCHLLAGDVDKELHTKYLILKVNISNDI